MVSTIYGYGDGWLLSLILNGVAMMTDGSSDWLYEIAAKVGFLVASVYAVAKNNPMYTAKWLAWYTVAMVVLFVPKTTVLIEDLVTRDKYAVKGIPAAMGEMASIVSTASYNITKTFEAVFKVPGKLQYGTSGLAFASKVMEDANHITIKDADIRANYHGYVGQCVFYDILLGGKYTEQELLATDDIWEMLETHASPVRRFTYLDSETRTSSLPTCKDGFAKLKSQWKKIIDDTSITWGKRYFHGSNTEAKVALLKGLQVADHYLGGASRDAGDIIKQKLLSNVIRDGFENNAARLDNAAMMQKLASDRARLQQNSAFNIMGDMAGESLVCAKGLFEAILYALFPVIMIMTIASLDGGKVLSQYLYLLVWINTWPIIYAVINMMMSVEGVFRVGAATATGDDSISWGASVAMHNIHSGIAAQAGMLSLSVPFLSQALLSKGAAAFTHLAGHLGGTSQAAAGKYAGMEADGDISFANRNYENVSRNNGGMFNVNKSSSFDYGSMSRGDGSGVRQTSNIGGKTIHQVDKSNMLDTITTSDGISSEASNRAGKSYVAAKSQATQAMDHNAAAQTSSLNLLKEFGKDVGTKGSWANRLSSQEQKVFSDARSHLKQQGINVDKMDGKTLAATGRAFAKFTPGGIAAKLAGAEAGVEGSAEFKGDSSKHNKYSKLEQAAHNKDLRKSLDRVQGSSQDLSFSEGESKVKKHADSIGSNLTKSKSLQTQSDASLRDAQNYDKTAALVKTGSAMLNQNHDQDIADMQNKLVNTPLSKGGISQAEYEAWRTGDANARKETLGRYTGKLSNDVSSNAAIKNYATPEQLKAKYGSDSQKIKQDNNIKSIAVNNNAEVMNATDEAGLNPAKKIDTSIQDNALKTINKNKQDISDSEGRLNAKTSGIENKVTNEQDKYLIEDVFLPGLSAVPDGGAEYGLHSLLEAMGGVNKDSVNKKIVDTGEQSMMVNKDYIVEPENDLTGGRVVQAGDSSLQQDTASNQKNNMSEEA